MRLTRIAALFTTVLLAAAAESPLPELKVEATDGGSVLFIRNVAAQPLTAYLIELVGYPGSSYTLYQEDIRGQPLASGGKRRIPVTSMTVGAAPEYVKMQAAIYADGSSAGTPAKISQLIGLRRTTLQTTRELIARIDQGKRADKGALVADLRAWAESIPAPTKRDRGTPAAITRSTTRELISDTAAQLEKSSAAEVLVTLTASERALASSKPPL
jgi:hypothetical protein